MVLFNDRGNAAAAALAVRQVAAGDFVHFGKVSLTTRTNRGDIANLGIVVGPDAVAIIDSGGGAKLDARCWLPSAQSPTDPSTTSSTRTNIQITSSAMPRLRPGSRLQAITTCRPSLPRTPISTCDPFAKSLGAAAIAEVRIIVSTLLVDNEITFDLGGRRLRLTAWSPSAHTACDLTVLDETTGTLFAGDLVFLQHIPVVDGSAVGWLKVLPRLAALPAERVVPGHGGLVASWPQALDDERRYLGTLVSDARRLVAAGVPLARAVAVIGLAGRSRWRPFDEYNPRHAAATFSELEWK